MELIGNISVVSQHFITSTHTIYIPDVNRQSGQRDGHLKRLVNSNKNMSRTCSVALKRFRPFYTF